MDWVIQAAGIILCMCPANEMMLHCNIISHWLGAYTKWSLRILCLSLLTHWGRVTHICVSKQTIIGSDNGLSPGRRQAIIWTNAGILLIGTPGTNLSEILIEIRIFSFKKMGMKVSSAKWRPFCLGLNVLKAPSSLPWINHSFQQMGYHTTKQTFLESNHDSSSNGLKKKGISFER